MTTIRVVWRLFFGPTFFVPHKEDDAYIIALPMETVPNEMLEDERRAVRKQGILYFILYKNVHDPEYKTFTWGIGHWHPAYLTVDEDGKFILHEDNPLKDLPMRTIDDL